MKIMINQETFELPAGATLEQALTLYDAKPPFAVAVNMIFIHRYQYADTQLEPDDRIEVVQPVAGG